MDFPSRVDMVEFRRAHPALDLPEVLLNIFRFDDVPLKSVILVNQRWFHCGIKYLWSTAPYESLASVPDHRRQMYASQIRELKFNGDDAIIHHEHFKNLEFLNLKRLSIDTYRPRDGVLYLSQYMQPTLEELEFYGGDIQPDLLDQVRTTCRRLRRIIMDSPGPHITPAVFLSFLKDLPSLEETTFKFHMDHLLTDEVLYHLAGRDNLRVCALSRKLDKDIINRILTNVSSPFTAIEMLDVSIVPSAVPLLVDIIQPLPRLGVSLNVEGEDTIGVLRHVTRLTNLSVLEVSFSTTTVLPIDDIKQLTKLTNLTQLEITTRGQNTTLEAPDFTDREFDHLLSHLPNLRMLSLEVYCTMSNVALRSVAKHCPKIQMFDSPAGFDLMAVLEEPFREPMFPELKELSIGAIEDVEHVENGREEAWRERARDLAKQMKKHFPKLVDLTTLVDNEFSDVFMEIWAEKSDELSPRA